ncbi:MAG: hypothetical protein ACP5QA_00050 [Phycisphaerae bacterium]
MGIQFNGYRWASYVSASRQGSARAAMLLLAVGAAFGLAAPAAHATLLVDESFNYPTLANGANMNGITATGVGLSGNYTAVNDSTKNPAGTFAYQTAGLSLGDLAVSGGSVAYQTGSGTYETGSLSAPFSASTSSSTLYGSYLFQLSKVGGNDAAGALMGPSGGIDKTSQVEPLVQAYGSGGKGAVGLSDKSIYSVLSGSSLSTGTTYINLFQVSGVGANSGTASLSEWILNSAQYSYFAGAGNLNASALSTAVTGAGPGDVTESGSISGTPTAGNYPSLASNLIFWGYSGSLKSDTQTFADYRLSDSSLAQAAPVATPEPGTLPMGIGMLAGGLLLLKRRKTV